MDARAPQPHLVWVTRSLALNPANVIGVFHGNHGEIEVWLPGHSRHFKEADLTADGRALLLPPPRAEIGMRPA